ncbi:MAG TPA: RNA polymerase sigma factor [Acidimicrobiales bacterium]|nr:RNA polymerase sigma factor [Acidimicrobiales bacterium]
MAAVLLARGLAGADVADMVQEVAVRALANRPAVADAEELSRWAYTVGRNLAVDRHRRARPVAPLADAGSNAGNALPEVGRVVEGRLEWERTLRAMSSLSDADRAALLATLTGASRSATRRLAVRDAVRLHRARSRLLARLGKAGALLGAGWRAVRKAAGLVPAPAATAALVVVAVILLLPATTPKSEAEPPRPVEPRAEARPAAAPAPAVLAARTAAAALTAAHTAAAPAVAAAPPASPTGPGKLIGPINKPPPQRAHVCCPNTRVPQTGKLLQPGQTGAKPPDTGPVANPLGLVRSIKPPSTPLRTSL